MRCASIPGGPTGHRRQSSPHLRWLEKPLMQDLSTFSNIFCTNSISVLNLHRFFKDLLISLKWYKHGINEKNGFGSGTHFQKDEVSRNQSNTSKTQYKPSLSNRTGQQHPTDFKHALWDILDQLQNKIATHFSVQYYAWFSYYSRWSGKISDLEIQIWKQFHLLKSNVK